MQHPWKTLAFMGNSVYYRPLKQTRARKSVTGFLAFVNKASGFMGAAGRSVHTVVQRVSHKAALSDSLEEIVRGLGGVRGAEPGQRCCEM